MRRRLFTIIFILALAVTGGTLACSSASPSPTPLPSATGAAATPRPSSTVPVTSTPLSPTPRPPTATPTPTVPAETTARQLRIFTQLWEAVRDTYVYTDFNGLDWDEVHQRYRARVARGMTDQAFYRAMKELVAELGDDHSLFNTPQEVAQEEEWMRGQLNYVGIGIYVTTLPDKGYAVLLQVFPDSPAAQAGLLAHDHILSVKGVPAVGEQGEDQLDLLSGPPGTAVTLTVQSPGQAPRQLSVTRARLQTRLNVEAHRLPGTDVGYVLIPTFWDRTIPQRVRQALRGLMDEEELTGLVLDMRINGGGLDTVLRDTLSIFVTGEWGTFVSREAERPLVVEGQPVGNSRRLPLVVLVGRETESYGEIFSGVLQESGRALIVGRTTEGNVETLWQNLFEDGSQAWIASETFRPPSGADWEESGIVPDVEIPLDWDEFAPPQDPQLQAALDWLVGQSDP